MPHGYGECTLNVISNLLGLITKNFTEIAEITFCNFTICYWGIRTCTRKSRHLNSHLIYILCEKNVFCARNLINPQEFLQLLYTIQL
jgi:hypothetical protein